jgi:hypothetical protein
VVEMSAGPVGLPAYAGSFDFVWLAPHFAQDARAKKNETTYCHQSGAEAAEGFRRHIVFWRHAHAGAGAF